MQKNIDAMPVIPARRYILLPLRLFLGITFVYAGIQKTQDPQFFSSSAPGYIGSQIARFAIGSPLHGLLVSVVEPHARLFGIVIIFGEVAIGLGTLFGFLFRPAACFGTLLSLLFFLSASWHVYPYFYGSDIVFAVGWLTLALNGPLFTGLPTLDEILSLRILQATPLHSQPQMARLLSIVLGTIGLHATPRMAQTAQPSESTQRNGQPTSFSQQNQAYPVAQPKTSRRTFLWGSLTGGAVTLSIFAIGYAFRILGSNSSGTTTTGTGSGSNIPDGPPTPIGTTTTGSVSAAGQIAQVSAVPANSAITFTLPSTGDPGVLVHLESGQFVAYDAVCTHAGCQVSYDTSSRLLECPCHGAAFDPAKGAEVVDPPASTPLTPVKITVDSATGAITLA